MLPRRPWAAPTDGHDDYDQPEPSDEQLAAAARADADAFGPLYARYVGPVYRYCHIRLGSREAAEDATSAVFLKALTALPGYREGNFAGWLFRITANTVRDHQRRLRPTLSWDAALERIDPTPQPDDVAELHIRAEMLRAALAQLPDDQRAAVELQLAGWPPDRIAASLGRSPAAVRMLRHRAMTRLRDLLRHEIEFEIDTPSGGGAR